MLFIISCKKDAVVNKATSEAVVSYKWKEGNLQLNNWDFWRVDYDKELFIEKIGIVPDSVTSAGASFIEEFGYDEFTYHFESSFVKFVSNPPNDRVENNPNHFFISDIELLSPEIKINGIGVGDSIDKVKRIFSKYNEESQVLLVYFSSNAFVFHYENNRIVKIKYFVPT